MRPRRLASKTLSLLKSEGISFQVCCYLRLNTFSLLETFVDAFLLRRGQESSWDLKFTHRLGLRWLTCIWPVFEVESLPRCDQTGVESDSFFATSSILSRKSSRAHACSHIRSWGRFPFLWGLKGEGNIRGSYDRLRENLRPGEIFLLAEWLKASLCHDNVFKAPYEERVLSWL